MPDTTLLSPDPMHRIRRLAATRRGMVAVPFLGADAATLLPLKPRSVLVTRLTAEDVRQGLVSPSQVLRYLASGVEVHSCSNLHAKVYVFGNRAVVGSANVSATSARLVEAAIETAEPAAVASARAFVESLCTEPVSQAWAEESLLPLYREDRVAGWSAAREQAAGPRSRRTRAEHSRLWVAPLIREDWPDDAREAATAARPLATRSMTDPQRDRLDEIHWNDGDEQRLSVGDRLVQRYAKGRGYTYDPPSRIVRIEPVASGGAIVFVERRKRLRSVGSKDLRARLGALAKDFVHETHRMRLVRSGEAAERLTALWPSLSAPG